MMRTTPCSFPLHLRRMIVLCSNRQSLPCHNSCERLVIVADVVVDMQAAVIRRRNDVLIGHLEESLIPLREIVVYRNVVLGSAPVVDLSGNLRLAPSGPTVFQTIEASSAR